MPKAFGIGIAIGFKRLLSPTADSDCDPDSDADSDPETRHSDDINRT